MALIQRLTVQNFRSHKKKTITLHPKTTVILGKNGAGKTSLLEAIYIALRGSSFKGTDKEVLRHGEAWWKIDITFDDEAKRSISFNNENDAKQKQTIVEGKKSIRLPQAQKKPVIIFEPDDLQLLHNSPSRRREFIDRIISQVDPLYGKILTKYERALRQRNALLKQGEINREYYFAWEVALSDYGSAIIARRNKMISRIDEVLAKTYTSIAKNKDVVTLNYPYAAIDHTPEAILKAFDVSFQKDSIVKHTTVGPHRHDLIFSLNNKPIDQTASRGEIRTTLLSLKFIEADIVELVLNEKPTILLDDVFSELDAKRQNLLISKFTDNQIIITSATINTELDIKNKISL